VAKKVATKKVSKKASKKVAKASAKKAPAKAGAKAASTGPWTLAKAMAALKAAGTEQTRKTWARHGFTGEMFGVKFADLYALRKQIGTDHALAKGLWDSGNVDAKLLATMVADPAAFTASDLDRWAASVESYGLANEIGNVVARCPYAVAQSAADRWVGSPREFLSRCGWAAVAAMLRDSAPIPPTRLRAYLRMIEERQATAPNRAREGMNLALIAIGAYGDEQLAKDALAAAKRIGPIRVDHGDTACKDFDPLVEIPKAREHRAKMAAKHSTKAT
jgi:3-methyladenine DNA glycosylase AlkD